MNKRNFKKDRILHLTLKKCWYVQILSGEKTVEYRELKPYWTQRLTCPTDTTGFFTKWGFREYDYIIFKNGYGKDVPTMKVEWKGCSIVDHEDFGNCYAIELGKVEELC